MTLQTCQALEGSTLVSKRCSLARSALNAETREILSHQCQFYEYSLVFFLISHLTGVTNLDLSVYVENTIIETIVQSAPATYQETALEWCFM